MHIFHPGPKLERWNRIFNKDGRALIVALDHIPSGLMNGWEYPEETLKKIIAGKPDAIMTNFGILKHFAPMILDNVGTILRVDGGPSYLLEEWPDFSKWEAFFSVEDAINVGADAVIVNAFIGGRAELDCFRVATRIAADCYKLGMPCAFEPIPSGKMIKNEYSAEVLSFACRMAAEFGADFIKTLYTGESDSFKKVTSRCPIPVLMAGGPKLEDELSLFTSVKGMLDGGGAGIFVGRNVWQHRNPERMLLALGDIIHNDASIEDALKLVRG